MTNVQTETKKGFVKYWTLEEPVVLKTTKNEIRFFNQHGKIQVYPKIDSGRGIGKGATINLDGFSQEDIETFKSNYTEMTKTEIFETAKSYWDKEEPVVIDNASNEVRFYKKHGKIQVFPKIKLGRGIGRGATINIDVPLSLRKEIDTNMLSIINTHLGIDFDDFQPVDETPDVVDNSNTSPTPPQASMGEYEMFKEFMQYAKLSEQEVLDMTVKAIFNNSDVSELVKSTLDNFVLEEALSVLEHELTKKEFAPYNYKEMFKSKQVLDGIQVNIIVDREFKFEWEELILNYLQAHPELIEEVDEVDSPSPYEEEVVEDVPTSEVKIDKPEVVGGEQNEQINKTEGINTDIIASFSNEKLKEEYLLNTDVNKKDYKPEYTVALFEEVIKRKKEGKML